MGSLGSLLILVGSGEPWKVIKHEGRGLDLKKLKAGRAVRGSDL